MRPGRHFLAGWHPLCSSRTLPLIIWGLPWGLCAWGMLCAQLTGEVVTVGFGGPGARFSLSLFPGSPHGVKSQAPPPPPVSHRSVSSLLKSKNWTRVPNNPEDKLTSETGSDKDSAKKIKQDNVWGKKVVRKASRRRWHYGVESWVNERGPPQG